MEEDQFLKDQTDHPNGTTAKYTAVREDQRPDLKKKMVPLLGRQLLQNRANGCLRESERKRQA